MSKIRREDLAQIPGMSPRLLRAFEDQSSAIEDAVSTVADTQALKDATVVVLSANGDFTNERILQVGDGVRITITDEAVKLSLKDVARSQDHNATFVAPADVMLFLPADGTLLSDSSLAVRPVFASLSTYANDAAAAAAGVPVRGGYINSATGAVTARLV
jgi:hypothetical protein